jgi:hypothetical protein
MRSAPFERVAGAAAFLVGVGGLLYSLSFVLLLGGAGTGAEVAGALFLLLGGLLSTLVLTAIYGRLRETDAMFALWAYVLGLAGALGSAVHGGYELAVIIHPQGDPTAAASAIDPRGLLTFGVTACALGLIGWLVLSRGGFSRRVGYLAVAAAVLLVIVYLGRLIIFDPENPLLLGAAAIVGFIVNPALYVAVGLDLRRSPPP